MALCSICSTIPFLSLPDPPKPDSLTLVNRVDMPELWYKNSTVARDSLLGFPWHEDLDTLAASAGSCPLCGLVQKGARSWLDQYENVLKNDKSFVEFDYQSRSPIPSGQRLFLTKRFGGAPGFLVLVRNPHLCEKRSALYLLTGVGFGAEAGLPWDGHVPLWPMDWDSRSPGSLKVAESWLKNCIDNHEDCEGSGTTLPSRVIDISSSSDIIKLIDGNGRSDSYASLSYCWGDGPHFITNRENISSRQSGFHLSELPKTLQDAVVIARHLGLGYLWIDSLCICQDDAEEWARDSSCMIDVYSNAHIVIAANHAENSSVGCFHIRGPRPRATITLPEGNEINVTVQAILLIIGDEYSWAAGGFTSEPLTGRGWALQERVLAKRVLHYNTRQMYFECDTGIVSEDGGRIGHRLCSLRGNKSVLEDDNHELWNNLLAVYGNRKLTKPTDKLPALSGLARFFEQRLGAKYVAGLWSDDLIEGLAWQGLGSRRLLSEPGRYTGPSWSWASYDGISGTGVRRRGFKDIAEVKDWHREIKTNANPYGEINDAWISIRAPMTKCRPSLLEINEHEIRLGRAEIQPLPRMCTSYSDNENGMIVHIDHAEAWESSEWRQRELEALMLGGYPKKRVKRTNEKKAREDKIDDVLDHCYCLVVMKVDESSERMRRVGWIFMGDEEAAKVRECEENWKTVTLV